MNVLRSVIHGKPKDKPLMVAFLLFLVCFMGIAAGSWVQGEVRTYFLSLGCELDWIGWVDLTIEGQVLVVTFKAVTWDPDVWLFNETQLYIGRVEPSGCEYSTFPWRHEDLKDVTQDEYRIELSDLGLECGDSLYFAAHAVISGRETWAFDENCTLISEDCLCAKYCSFAPECEEEDPGKKWPMFHHDIHRSGYTDSPGPARNFTLWTFEAGHNIFSSPAISEGRVYFGSRDFNFYCLNSTSGAHLWNFTARSTPHSPAVAYGLVYFGSSDFRVYCLNATTGELVWEHRTGYYVDACPAVYHGRVYVGSMDNHFYCLDAYTGALAWKFEAKDNFDDSSAALHDGRVYVGCTDSRLLCLDAYDGMLLWQFETGGGIHSSPALNGDFVYFGSMDGNVYCISAIDGSLVWNYTTGSWVLSSPAVASGRIFVGSNDRQAYCLNSTTGERIWSYNTGMEISASPAIANETVYFGSNDGWIRCLDAKSGALIWYYDSRAMSYSSPAIADGRLYIGSFDHRLHAIGSKRLSFGTDPGELVSIESNSVVGGFYFDDNEREFGFSSSGEEDNPAFVNITLPRDMLGVTPVAYEDGKPITSVVTYNATHTAIYVEFVNGRHDMRVAAVPEISLLHASMVFLSGLLFRRAGRRTWSADHRKEF